MADQQSAPTPNTNVSNGTVTPSMYIQQNRTPENEQGRTQKYDAFSRAPYVLLAKIPSQEKSNRNSVSMLEASKKFISANVKFERVEKYAFNTWKLTFKTKNLANYTISNRILQEMGIRVFIHKYKHSRKIVIKGIPLDMSLEEIKEAIEKENPRIVIVKSFRLKIRDRVTKQRVDSTSICLEIRGETIPEALIILKTVNPVKSGYPIRPFCENLL